MNHTLQKRIIRTLAVILPFLIYKYQIYIYGYGIIGAKNWNQLDEFFRLNLVLFVGIILALLSNYMLNKRISVSELGLNKHILPGLLWAFVFTLPMFVGLPFLVNFDLDLHWKKFYQAMILAGFGEEFIFRGFLFGLLFYYARWGFLSAGILTGLFFGMGHLYQADSFGSALGIFAFTCGASLGFAWFYHAWGSLWMVLFLHGFMDLAWDISMNDQLADNVLGSPWVNVFRFSTLIFAIVYSIFLAKRNGRYDLKNKLWVNSPTAI